jgi:hypothetical protein
MNFEIVAGGDDKMYEGQIIEYRVEFLCGVKSLWLTEIAHVREHQYFFWMCKIKRVTPNRQHIPDQKKF